MASAELELSGGTATTDQASSSIELATFMLMAGTDMPNTVLSAPFTGGYSMVARFGPVRLASRPQRAHGPKCAKTHPIRPETTVRCLSEWFVIGTVA